MTLECCSDLKRPHINLGCGEHILPGWHNVDKTEWVSGTTVHDLDLRPWPFPDDFASHILARHIVEHVESLVAFMDECHRVLRVFGYLEIYYPDAHNYDAWTDPTHKRAVTKNTWGHFTRSRKPYYGLPWNLVEEQRPISFVRIGSTHLPIPMRGGERKVVLRPVKS